MTASPPCRRSLAIVSIVNGDNELRLDHGVSHGLGQHHDPVGKAVDRRHEWALAHPVLELSVVADVVDEGPDPDKAMPDDIHPSYAGHNDIVDRLALARIHVRSRLCLGVAPGQPSPKPTYKMNRRHGTASRYVGLSISLGYQIPTEVAA